MQAHDMPFSKLINVDQGAREHFHVPKYQREYTWRKWQWDQLLNDIEDNDPGYFMGSIICVSDKKDLSPGDEIIFEVVDGQQRLTTLSILLAVVHAKLAGAMPQYDATDEDIEEAKTSITNIRAKLAKRKRDPRRAEEGSFKLGKNTYFLRVQPSAQNHNLDDYRYLLSQAGVIEGQPKPPYCGNRLLSKAYGHFLEKTPSDVAALLSLVEKINQLMFVQITVGSQSDAFTLFESLNNRGVPLSAMDIIKNKLLAQMDRKHDVDVGESFDRWQTIVEAVPDATDQERFLRHLYNAYKHRKEIRVDKAPKATRSLIIRIYETLINRDAEILFAELERSATVYGKLLRADDSNEDIARNLLELERISSAPVYVLLLYLFSLTRSQLENSKFLPDALDLLCRYFVRRNVTDTPPTRQIDQGLIDLIEACAAKIKAGDKLKFSWFVDELIKRTRPASLDEFKAALSGGLYEVSSAMARYVLIQADQAHHSREYKPDLWARDDKDRFVWTVEHVLPQTERLPDHWVQMIASGDRAMAADLQDRLVHKLGNLTLSGYNSDLATASFEKKQKLSKDRSVLGHRINIGYMNGLRLNSLPFKTESGRYSLADAPHWKAEMIEARTNALVDLIVKQNLLPGEK